MKKVIFIVVISTVFFQNNFAKISVPSVFSDNMVLQQNSTIAIWGWAKPGEIVNVVTSWNIKDTIKVKCNNIAKWIAAVKTIGAGGPYSIQVLGSTNVLLSNIMLGEVWLCSGQSNMEWNVNKGIINGESEANNANNPNIRFFHIQKTGADFPQENCNATWGVSSPETMRRTSAVGYFFARELQQKLNVPIGIIISAWGGTPAEVWIQKERIENNVTLSKDKFVGYDDYRPDKPGVLYNSMISPIIPYGIAGAIWYQGESNIMNSPIYSLLMKTLIESWRADFKKDFPFYFVQIAPFNYGDVLKSHLIREQQEIASKIIPNTGMVVVSDLVDNINDIHPINKQDVGKRLANYALAEIYKQVVGNYKSPNYASMKIEKGKVRVFFNNSQNGLKTRGKTALQFQIAGDDKKFVNAHAKIEGRSVILFSKEVKSPVAVRYCFDNTSIADVFSTEGLPLAPFRTDKW